MIIYQLALRQLTATFGGSWWLRGPASSQKQRLPTSNHQMVHGSHHPNGIFYEWRVLSLIQDPSCASWLVPKSKQLWHLFGTAELLSLSRGQPQRHLPPQPPRFSDQERLRRRIFSSSDEDSEACDRIGVFWWYFWLHKKFENPRVEAQVTLHRSWKLVV